MTIDGSKLRRFEGTLGSLVPKLHRAAAIGLALACLAAPPPLAAQDASRKLRRAESLFRERRFEDAAEALRALVARGEHVGEAARLLGHACYELGRKPDARAAFARAIAAGRFDEDVLLRAAELAGDAGDLAGRRELLSLARLVAPERWDVALHLALLDESFGRAESAEATYRMGVEKDPFDRDARVRLAELLLARGDHEGAAAQYRVAHVLGDPDGAIARRLGDMAYAGKDLDSAARWYERVLERAPADRPDVESAVRLAKLHLILNDSGSAARVLESLRGRLGDDALPASAWETLGHARLESGDVDAFVEAWEKAFEAGSSNPEVARRLALHAWSREGGRDAEKALRFTERWVELAPESEEALQLLASAYAERGRRAKAEEALVRLVRAHGLTRAAREIVRELATSASSE